MHKYTHNVFKHIHQNLYLHIHVFKCLCIYIWIAIHLYFSGVLYLSDSLWELWSQQSWFKPLKGSSNYAVMTEPWHKGCSRDLTRSPASVNSDIVNLKTFAWLLQTRLVCAPQCLSGPYLHCCTGFLELTLLLKLLGYYYPDAECLETRS